VVTRRQQLAPVIDGLCIVAFILVGRDSHDGDGGLAWFLSVFWPLAAGWAVAALGTRLYTRAEGTWIRLGATVAIGVLVGGLLRGAFTDRLAFSAFTVVAFCFLTLTTFAWRGIWLFFARRSRAVAA
jgi:hypothetical protein